MTPVIRKGCPQPETAFAYISSSVISYFPLLQPLSHLHRISLTLLISHRAVHLGLLGGPVLKEVLCNSREQCITQHILILLLPLCAFLLKLRKLRRNQVGWTAGDWRLIADDLLLDFRIKGLNGLAELAQHDLLGLLGNHLIALAHDDVHDSLGTDNL